MKVACVDSSPLVAIAFSEATVDGMAQRAGHSAAPTFRRIRALPPNYLQDAALWNLATASHVLGPLNWESTAEFSLKSWTRGKGRLTIWISEPDLPELPGLGERAPRRTQHHPA